MNESKIIYAIENWQRNRQTTFTPSNILQDFGDEIIAALRAPAPQEDGRVLAPVAWQRFSAALNQWFTLGDAENPRMFEARGERTRPLYALSAPPSVALEALLEPFAKLAALFDNYEIDRRKPEADSVLVNVKLDDLRKARAALSRPQPGGAVAGTAPECPHVKPPANLSEPCQICGALGPWFDGDCAVAGTDHSPTETTGE